MKKLFLSLTFVLMGSFVFANTSTIVKPVVHTIKAANIDIKELEKGLEILGFKNLKISNFKYNDANVVCGFTLSSDDGQGNAWSTWYDCTDMTMDDIVDFIMIFFFSE
jgi:hypothetical protein